MSLIRQSAAAPCKSAVAVVAVQATCPGQAVWASEPLVGQPKTQGYSSDCVQDGDRKQTVAATVMRSPCVRRLSHSEPSHDVATCRLELSCQGRRRDCGQSRVMVTDRRSEETDVGASLRSAQRVLPTEASCRDDEVNACWKNASVPQLRLSQLCSLARLSATTDN